jgi:hypothetical protein
MTADICPDYIVHYYEAELGPFRNLSDLSHEEAEAVLANIRAEGILFASKRTAEYLSVRRTLEQRVRQLFIAKGGQPKRLHPHYFILGHCDWVNGWFRDGRAVRIPLREVAPQAVSFTYGDSFPAMRYQDGKPYRGQVYVLAELPGLIERYGLPQVWNPEGTYGPERYIEAQVWDDTAIASVVASSH